MKNKPISRLGVGPMSSEIIEAVYKYSSLNNTKLMLIASKNQIDWNGGYVNNWNTKKYVNFISKMKKMYPNAVVFICRDHCGPGFNKISDLRDTYKTIESDIENGFDLIHVDLCHYLGSRTEAIKKTKDIIQFIQRKSNKILIEVGTDENTGRNLKNIRDLEQDLKFFSEFCKPSFYVCQTGSVIKETGQFGKFNKIYIRKVKKLFDKYDFIIKEHNADYLSADEIKERKGLVGSQNVAPQFGNLQTLLTLQKCYQYGINPNHFLNDSYNSRKWEKWLYKNNKRNKLLCSIIAGHYNFSSSSYDKIYKKIQAHENFRENIIDSVMKTISLYINN